MYKAGRCGKLKSGIGQTFSRTLWMLELTVAIPFYDRIDLLRHCLRTLSRQTSPQGTGFVAYGDGGFDRRALAVFAEHMPECEVIIRQEKLGASGNVRSIIEEFAGNPHSRRLLICDSDMIARTDLVETVKRWPARDDLLITAYNSCLHQPSCSDNSLFQQKKSVGSTGTLWTPRLAEEVLKGVAGADHFDDKFSAFLVAQGVPIRCCNRSLLQHLGFSGENNRYFGTIDFGLNFEPDGPEQHEAMADMLNYIMANQAFFSGKASLPSRSK